jgi:hypothetical protein
VNQNTTDTTPVLSPILNLLRSRAFWVMVFTAIIDAVIAAVPPDFAPILNANKDTLITVITGLALALIGKLTVENAVQIHSDGKVEAATQNANAAASVAQAAASNARSTPER